MRNWHGEIEDDLKWRENELQFLKKIAFDTREDHVKNVTALRSLWVMLYAHYEGFCKFVWDIYLDHIEQSRVQNKNLSSSIMLISLSKELDRKRKGITNKLLCDFCAVEYHQYLEQYAHFSDENKLSTKSNLYPNVMDENNEKLSLSLSSLAEGNNRTNIKALVSRRNDIAHGKKMYIRNLEEYQIYEESAFNIMIDLACEIIEAIEQRIHLKT